MIYHIHWGSVNSRNQHMVTAWNKAHYPNKAVGEMVADSPFNSFGKFVEESEDDTFMFVLVKDHYNQLIQFDEWLDKFKLHDLVRVRTGMICNPVHPGSGNNLQLVVMQSRKHFQRDLEKKQ